MAILTESGRIALAKRVKELPIFMAWGEGEGASSKDGNIEKLKTPLGILNAAEVAYVTSVDINQQAEIDVDTGKFNRSKSGVPTKHLYFKFQFDFEDAQGKIIKELGVFVGKKVGAPQDTGYQQTSKMNAIIKACDLLLFELRKPIHRDEGVRETFEFVITF
tara:strand:- start:1364 stop:1849 length:486 start_codon:yes stop_codon:yes gene_type:complete